MKSCIRFSFLLIILLISFVSCRKYPEDNLISFTTPFKRVTSHSWKVSYFGVDYKDSTLQTYFSYHAGGAYQLGGTKLLFYSYYINPENTYRMDENGVYSGFWHFFHNNKYIEIYTNRIDGAVKHIQNYQWKILKLTNTEFRISTVYNGKHYEIHFNQA